MFGFNNNFIKSLINIKNQNKPFLNTQIYYQPRKHITLLMLSKNNTSELTFGCKQGILIYPIIEFWLKTKIVEVKTFVIGG